MVRSAIVRELGAVVIDINYVERVSAFWCAVLGQEPGQLRSRGDWLTVGTLAGNTWLVLQRVPESKAVKNRVHIDFRVDDVDEAIAHIVALEGSHIGGPKIGGGVTMADPEGNEFCIGAFRRTREGTRTPL